MSTEDILDIFKIKPVKRKSPDSFIQENISRKYEIGEASTSFLSNEAELLQKYEKIPTSQLDTICEQLMFYDSKGFYMPPEQYNPFECPKKKKYYKNQDHKPCVDSAKIETNISQASVDVATEIFGPKSENLCRVSNFVSPQTHFVHSNSHLGVERGHQSVNIYENPQVKVEKLKVPLRHSSHNFGGESDSYNNNNTYRPSRNYLLSQRSPPCSTNSKFCSSQSETKILEASSGPSFDKFVYNSALLNCHKTVVCPDNHNNDIGPQSSGNFRENFDNKMADALSSSEFQRKDDSFSNTVVFSNEELAQFSAFLDNTNAIDLSVSNLNHSDSSDTIYYSDDSSSSLLNRVGPPPEAETETTNNINSDLVPQSAGQNLSQQDVSVINISDVTTAPENNAEIVDLTNYTPIINTTEIIELLDDTFQTPNPPIVETIDLVESSDDEEPPTVTSSKSERSQSKSFECPICFDPLKNKRVMTTICGHIFCSTCIKSAIKQKRCCPTCRKKLTSKDYHLLYLNL